MIFRVGAVPSSRGVSSSRHSSPGAETAGRSQGDVPAGDSSDLCAGGVGCWVSAFLTPTLGYSVPCSLLWAQSPSSPITRPVPPILVPFVTTSYNYQATGLCSKQGLAHICQSKQLQGDLCILPAVCLDFILVIVICVGCSLWSPKPPPGLE